MLYGLNEDIEDVKGWVADMHELHNTSMKTGLGSLAPIPIVLHKELLIAAVVPAGEIRVVLQRNKKGEFTTGITMKLEDYREFQGRFGTIKRIIEAIQEGGDIKPFLQGAKVERDFYGWFFARTDMSSDIKLTIIWNPTKRQTLVKLHRGRVSPQDGVWYPDKQQEICFGAGGMLYLMKYAAPKAERLITWWEVALEATDGMLEDAVFQGEEKQVADYNEEMAKAVAALSADPEWSC